MNSRISKGAPDGFEHGTLHSPAQRGTTEPVIAAAETTANLCYLCNNLIDSIRAGVFCYSAPSVSPLFVVRLPPNLA